MLELTIYETKFTAIEVIKKKILRQKRPRTKLDRAKSQNSVYTEIQSTQIPPK